MALQIKKKKIQYIQTKMKKKKKKQKDEGHKSSPGDNYPSSNG